MIDIDTYGYTLGFAPPQMCVLACIVSIKSMSHSYEYASPATNSGKPVKSTIKQINSMHTTVSTDNSKWGKWRSKLAGYIYFSLEPLQDQAHA